MRWLRTLVVLVSLCLFLGTSAASAVGAAPSAPAGREIGGLARTLGYLGSLLKAVWEAEGTDIDPLGKPAGAPVGNGSNTATTDEAGHIDPLGGSGQ